MRRLLCIAGALLLLLGSCAKSPERNLRLSNPSNESQISEINLRLDGQSLTGRSTLTLGPLGQREYRKLQVSWGNLHLRYRYADAATTAEFTTNLATQLGAEYSGTIEIAILSSSDVEIRKVDE